MGGLPRSRIPAPRGTADRRPAGKALIGDLASVETLRDTERGWLQRCRVVVGGGLGATLRTGLDHVLAA